MPPTLWLPCVFSGSHDFRSERAEGCFLPGGRPRTARSRLGRSLGDSKQQIALSGLEIGLVRARASAGRRFTKSASCTEGPAKRRSVCSGKIETYRGGICGRLLGGSLRLTREAVKQVRGATKSASWGLVRRRSTTGTAHKTHRRVVTKRRASPVRHTTGEMRSLFEVNSPPKPWFRNNMQELSAHMRCANLSQ